MNTRQANRRVLSRSLVIESARDRTGARVLRVLKRRAGLEILVAEFEFFKTSAEVFEREPATLYAATPQQEAEASAAHKKAWRRATFAQLEALSAAV